jgi:phosphate transport system protein
MREAFHRDLAQLGDELVGMSSLATEAIRRATQALAEADLVLAEQVISADQELDVRGARCEEHACMLLALQGPVAGDLRMVVTALKVGEKIQRMGDLARHIAELARRRHPDSVLPPGLTGRFVEMGRLAAAASRRVEVALSEPTGDQFAEQDRADDTLDRLHAAVLDEVIGADPPYPTQVGVDVALLARFYERFADQAVAVTRQLDYAVEGVQPG